MEEVDFSLIDLEWVQASLPRVHSLKKIVILTKFLRAKIKCLSAQFT